MPYTGWMRPISHEIVKKPTPVKCPPSAFYFDNGNDSILLSNKTTVKHLPFIPLFEDDTDSFVEPTMKFGYRGVYSPDEISEVSISFDLQANLAENNRLENAINKKMESEELNESEIDLLSDFFGSLYDHFVSEYKWICGIIIVFGMLETNKSLLCTMGMNLILFFCSIGSVAGVWVKCRQLHYSLLEVLQGEIKTVSADEAVCTGLQYRDKTSSKCTC